MSKLIHDVSKGLGINLLVSLVVNIDTVMILQQFIFDCSKFISSKLEADRNSALVSVSEPKVGK